ncbi:HAMP domain-containing methyl-accepting chemotaxis protein [Shinella zoogloeoides]|uniref:HAMP domain-containing protein n=1 Tax=Shinella zoogloeoides TaxID=352475 RepID=A0A6N8TID9_SHIZO|nr:methyl-accepting chemotaxis protein [Shinella zoogloeoides]MXO00988.1 HAMP domain-containing protein [Shinella zoogloeoides]UEX80515.1 methyl-accepting chemotaxis protein [Shinella zoogloeoides]
MQISTKLGAVTLFLTLLLAGAISSTYLVLNTMSASMNTIVIDRLIPAAHLKKVGDLYAVNIVDTAHKVRSGALSWEEGHRLNTEAVATIQKLWSDYTATYLTDEERALASQMTAEMQKQADSIGQLLAIMKAQDKAALDTYVETRLYPTIDPIGTYVASLIDLQTRVGEEEFAKASASKQFNLVLLAVFGIVALAVSALSFWIIIAGVSRPLTAITTIMQSLAGGMTDFTVPFRTRKDEIGSIAGAVEIFRQSAIEKRMLEKEAEAARLQAEADRVRLQEEAEAAAQQRLREATSGLAGGLRRLAAGDLTFQLTEPFAPDFEELRNDLNAAVDQLGEALRAVAQSVDEMDTGTREISTGADSLSRRTEQQAASLEQTAAALDEITANVTNSTRRAEEARAVAAEANGAATHSGGVVADAVNAMQRIEQSSQQISSIIGVIDEIAFQTNLLALNAGVEAARAGEAGKGFAVVAQEVRELAQRSAQAAKEIKGLIRNSEAEVKSGVTLVSETGDALQAIGSHVATINQHMEAIAVSAREQSVGLSEINTAVNQMDQTTQQNAAMVEETNAASATLVAQAEKLRSLIGRFTLGHQARQAQPAPQRMGLSRPRIAGNTALKAESWEEF